MASSGSSLNRLILLPAFLFSINFAMIDLVLPLAASAQDENKVAVEGYITAVYAPTGFDVNGQHVKISPETLYGTIGAKAGGKDSGSADSISVGAFVQVIGKQDKKAKNTTAKSVLFRDSSDKKLSGMGVSEKVIIAGPEPVFQADGYRIRIASTTNTTFTGDLKTLADVGPNTWISYEGTRDKTGVLVATSAKFEALKPARPKATTQAAGPQNPKPSKVSAQRQNIISQDSLLDADGNIPSLRTKVRYSNAGGWCGWHKAPADQALQERVRRVGMKLVPGFQSQLADDQRLKFPFRFYAVDEARIRSDISCNAGLVLVPRQVVERLKNDDQLAAVLADGVAFNLQRYSPKLNAEWWELLGVEMAADVALSVVPGGYLVTGVGAGVVQHKMLVQMEEQRGRVALSLMADAGYNPWQAPEAWRLLEPKKLPADLDSLKYPNRSGYQLGILSLQYKRGSPVGDAKADAADPH